MIVPGVTATGACSSYLVTDADSHGIAGATFVAFVNLSQSVTVQAFDGEDAVTPAIALGACQVFVMPLGGVSPKSGFIAVKCSGAPATGVLALYQ